MFMNIVVIDFFIKMQLLCAEPNSLRLKENGNENNDGKKTEACSYKYSELVAATQDFTEDNLIGEGGFGGVYKGLLESGQVIN